MQKGIVIGLVIGLILAFAIFSVGLYSGNVITGNAFLNLFGKGNTQTITQQNAQPTANPNIGLNKTQGQIVNLPACFFIGEQGGDMEQGPTFPFWKKIMQDNTIIVDGRKVTLQGVSMNKALITVDGVSQAFSVTEGKQVNGLQIFVYNVGVDSQNNYANVAFGRTFAIATDEVCNYFNKVNGYNTFENKDYVPVVYTERNIYQNYIGNNNCDGTPLETVKSLWWNLNAKANIALFIEATPNADKGRCISMGSYSYRYQFFNTGVLCCAQDDHTLQ